MTNFKVFIYDNRNNITYDVSSVVGEMTITTYMEDNPGKCEFTVYAVSPLAFWEGATVTVILDGYNMFKGYVFKKSRDQDVKTIKVTAYDQLRYLKNKDSAVFEYMTSDQIFTALCNKFQLQSRIVDKSSHVCTPRSEDATSIYDMIKNALDDTLANSNKWFFIRDNFGTLEHLNIMSCVRKEILGDKSFVTGFDYETSIDEDVYNKIKMYRDNESTGKREVFEVFDSNYIQRWGILQLYEKVDENLSLAQIDAMGQQMLKYYKSTRRSLTLHCLGIKEFFAGCVFRCKIADLGDLSMDSYLIVTECTHTINNDEHTMDLKTEVVRSE